MGSGLSRGGVYLGSQRLWRGALWRWKEEDDDNKVNAPPPVVFIWAHYGRLLRD
jgi:hypothetical protein